MRKDAHIEEANGTTRVRGVTGMKEGIKNVRHELLGKCLLVEQSPYNLISWSRLKKNGFKIRYDEIADIIYVHKSGLCNLSFRPKGPDDVYSCRLIKKKSFWTNCEDEEEKCDSVFYLKHRNDFSKVEIQKAERALEIHRELGHASDSVVSTMLDNGYDQGLTSKDLRHARQIFGKCQSCTRGKMTRRIKQTKEGSYSDVDIGEVLHADLMFIQKHIYVITTDQATGYISVARVKDKGKEQVMDGLTKIIAEYRSMGYHTRRICSDREGAIAAEKLDFNNMGISLYKSDAEGHNARVERGIRTVKGKIRAIFFDLQFKLPMDWLDHLVIYTVQCCNLVPNNKTGQISPYCIVTKDQNIEWIKRYKFGDIVLARVPYVQKSGSLAERAEYAIILGRDLLSNKVFTVYRVEKGSIANRSKLEKVEFHHLPQHVKVKINQKIKLSLLFDPESLNEGNDNNGINIYDGLKNAENELISRVQRVKENQNIQNLQGSTYSIPERVVVEDYGHHNYEQSQIRTEDIFDEYSLKKDTQLSLDEVGQSQGFNSANNENMSYGTNYGNIRSDLEEKVDGDREDAEEKSNWLEQQNFEAAAARNDPDDSGIYTRTRSRAVLNTICQETSLEQENDLDMNKGLSEERKSRNVEQVAIILLTLAKAMKTLGSEKVMESLKKEVVQLLETGTFEPCSRLQALQSLIIPTSVVVVEKESGVVKSRIVANGNLQDRSIYRESEVSSPTLRTETLFILFSVAASRGHRLCSFDVAGAYLKAPLPNKTKIAVRFGKEVTKILMNLDETTNIDHLGHAYGKLKKGLYGLIEAGMLWYQHLSNTLEECGYEKSKYDSCLFRKKGNGEEWHYIGIYVDDLILSSRDDKEVTRVRCELEKKYGKMKSHTEDNFKYRGLMIKQLEGEIFVNQEEHVIELCNLLLGKDEKIGARKRTPCGMNLLVVDENSPIAKNPDLFRTGVAKAIWLASQTRPDIKLVASFLSSRLITPTRDDEKKLMHLVRYLHGSMEIGLHFRKEMKVELIAQADASWQSNSDHTGQTGGILRLGENLIGAISKKQKMITRSSSEAEIVALEVIACEVQWCRNLLEEIGYKQGATVIHQDNLSTISLVEGGRLTSKIKHMNWRHMRVSDLVKIGEVRLEHLRTDRMEADMLTKPLGGDVYEAFRDKMMNRRVCSESRVKSVT
jgi:hypothetical protein